MSHDDLGEFYFRLALVGFTISFLALCLISLAILTDKRVKESHPNRIIAYICLCDAYNYYQMGSRYIYCGFQVSYYLDIIFSETVLRPCYYMLFNWFGMNSVNGMNYDELI